MNSYKLLDSLKYVNENSNFVSINYLAIDLFVKNFSLNKSTHWSKIYPLRYKRRVKDEDELDFLFLIGSQAFYFWGYPEKWTINYKGSKLDGWWALIASFERALDQGVPILDGKYLVKMSLDDTKKLFDGLPEIPLLKERLQILKRIGETLVKKYNGRFHNFYEDEEKEACTLLEKINKEFAGFDDIFKYKGQKIYFYKKAQVVLSDIAEIFNHHGLGDIKNMDKLPGHADYKIPAVLRKLGILIYSKELAKKVDNRVEIPSGSEEEMEIRANMLWANHLICEKLKDEYPEINSILLNGILWNMSQVKEKGDKPYHLTKTIYY